MTAAQEGSSAASLRSSAREPGAPPAGQPLRLGVLISGGGTGLQNLIDRIADGRLTGVVIAGVISSRREVPGVERARRAGLPVEIIRVRDHPDAAAFTVEICKCLDSWRVDLAVQAGWLCWWLPPPRWNRRVINIHPALLPRFGGRGFYGLHVHRAVLAAGERESGATVHWVDDQYDHGEIIAQRPCPVLPGDTPETLAARVLSVEFELLPDVIAGIRDHWLRLGRPDR